MLIGSEIRLWLRAVVGRKGQTKQIAETQTIIAPAMPEIWASCPCRECNAHKAEDLDYVIKLPMLDVCMDDESFHETTSLGGKSSVTIEFRELMEGAWRVRNHKAEGMKTSFGKKGWCGSILQ